MDTWCGCDATLFGGFIRRCGVTSNAALFGGVPTTVISLLCFVRGFTHRYLLVRPYFLINEREACFVDIYAASPKSVQHLQAHPELRLRPSGHHQSIDFSLTVIGHFDGHFC